MPESKPLTGVEREPAEPQSARPDLAPRDWNQLERMLDELPPGIPILPREDATNFSKYRYPPPIIPSQQAWKICADAMEKHDSELCKAYREEIDTLLVFAGLFSAVVTAFTIESYQWLQDDPNDTTNAVLAQISQFVAPNGTATIPPSSSSMARSVSARINAYWFISLALSLSAALGAILGKQWVREFERRAADMKPKDAVGVRQLKLEGLEYWKVGDIISALPMLLQLSLALFALGILELLWHLHVAVAIALCIPTALAMLFYLATTLIPVLQYSQRYRGPLPPQCAYKSPQALVVIQVYQFVVVVWLCLRVRLFCLFSNPPFYWRDREVWNKGWTNTWSKWDYGFHATDRYSSQPPLGKSHSRGLDWLQKNVDERTVGDAYWNCLWEQAHSVETHPIDILSRGNEHDTRSRMSLMRAIKELEISLSMPPLWQRALPFLKRTDMSREALSEILIQSLPAMTVSTAQFMLGELELEFSNDPELVRSLVRAVLSYERQHVYEDIASVINSASNIVARCPDYATESMLQWVLVSIAANRLDSHRVVQPDYVPTIKHAFDMLSRSPEAFVHHPQCLHHLPHILALAASVRAEYECNHGHLIWPMPGPRYDGKYTLDGKGHFHPELEPIVMEVFKIAACGVDRDSPIETSEHTNGRRDSIAHEDLPLLDAVPPAGAAGTAAAEMALPSEAGQTPPSHSYEGALSTASFPGQAGSSHALDARDSPLHTEIAPAVDAVELIIVPAERGIARTSADAGPLESHVMDDVGFQDAGGRSTLLPSDREGGDSTDVVHAGDAGVRAARGLAEDPDPPPQASSVGTPPPTTCIPVVPPSPRSRDPLASAFPDEQAREATHADEPGGRVGVHAAAEQPDAASGVQSTTVAAADDRSSAVSDNADVSQTLAEGIATGAGGGSVRAADEEVASLALHAHAEQPELSIPLESHREHRASRSGTRALEEPSTDERHTRTESSSPAGLPETQLRESAEAANPSPQRTVHAPGRALEASALLPEPSPDASIATAPAVSHSDDPSAAEGVREQPDEIGGRRESLDE